MKLSTTIGLLVCLLLCLPASTAAEGGSANWIDFGSAFAGNAPDVQAQSSWDGIDIWIQVPGVNVRDVKTKSGVYTRLAFDDDAFRGAIGSPRIPVIRKFVEIPYGAEIDLEILSEDAATLDLATRGFTHPLVPVQAPVPKLPGALEAAPFNLDASVYGRDSFLVGQTVRIQKIDALRGYRIAVLEICPVDYNPVQNTIRAAGMIHVRLNLTGSDRALTESRALRYATPVFEQLLSNMTLNHGAYRNFQFPPDVPIGYLIICHDDYIAAYDPFVQWKTLCGCDVTVTPTSVTGTGTANIKNYIQEAYDTWTNPPVYVLLGSDTDTVACFTGESSGSADDNQYSELEGTGHWTPDIMIGRFPVRSVTDLENILEKVLQVEQMTMPSTDYFKDSVWLASSDHSTMLEATHEWCFDNHVYPLDPVNNTFHAVYERLGGGTQDFADNVDAGRGIVCYSGHGYGNGSGTASVHFVHENVSALTNTDLYGHVMVFACGTNLHDQEISFGERWLLEPDKGSASYWGTSDSSYWDEDDWEQREIYRSQHEDLIHTLSAMYFWGLIEVYNQGSSSSGYYFDIYNLMGDPSSDFLTRIPQTMVLDCLPTTTPNEQDFVRHHGSGGRDTSGGRAGGRQHGRRPAGGGLFGCERCGHSAFHPAGSRIGLDHRDRSQPDTPSAGTADHGGRLRCHGPGRQPVQLHRSDHHPPVGFGFESESRRSGYGRNRYRLRQRADSRDGNIDGSVPGQR
ncbi:hypothetical protein JXA40_06720 [bacterium]|nr:hypothetical protein [candidate division CSSED10-310 bacterium]